MSAERRASIKLNLRGDLDQQAPRFARSLRQIGTAGEASFGRLGRVATPIVGTLDRIGNRYLALGTGAVGVQAVRDVANLQRQFTRLGIQTGKTKEEMDALRQRIFDVAQEEGIRLDPDELLGAVAMIVEKTGDLDFATANLRNLAIAIQATGAEGSAVGAIFTEMREKFKLASPDELIEGFSKWVEQGKAGAMPLDKLASLGERIAASYASMGREGPAAVAESGALVQVFRQGVGSAEQAVTAFEGVMRVLRQRAVELDATGVIDIFDEEALARGERVFNSVPDILEQLLRLTEGDTIKLATVFNSDEAMRGINALKVHFDKTSGIQTAMRSFMDVQADVNQLQKDSARAASDASADWAQLSSVWREIANNSLLPVLKEVTGFLQSVGPEGQAFAMQMAVGGGAGAVVAGKVGGAVLRSRADKAARAAAIAEDAVSPAARAARAPAVPGQATRAAVEVAEEAAGPAAKMMRGSRALRGLGRLAGPLAAAYDLYRGYEIATDDDLSGAEKAEGIAGVAGGAGGALAGGAIGAGLGTMLLPGVGTVIGGGLGAIAGSFGGEALMSELVGSLMGGGDEPAAAQGGRDLGRIAVDIQTAAGLEATARVEAAPEVELDVNIGPSMVTP